MITLRGPEVLEPLRARLEEQYEGHTEQLARLMAPAKRRRTGTAPTVAAKEAEAEQSRRAIAQVARALQRMAEGTYGRCAGCALDIPFERLHRRPADPYCADCA